MENKQKLISRPAAADETKRELLRDLNFARGLGVTLFHSNSSAGRIAGILDFGGCAEVKSTPEDRHYVWDIAQWGCRHDLAKEGIYTRKGSIHTYRDAGKVVSLDTEGTGRITLGIKGSEEYTPDASGALRERTDAAENWPHILLGCQVEQTISPEAKQLIFEIHYTITRCDDLVDRSKYPADPEKNAAQFQWFITLRDEDPSSESFGQSMWFGFSMFDTRAAGGTPHGFDAYDGGKEDNTGMFIHMFSLEEEGCEADLPTAVVGVPRRVRVDFLPHIRRGLELAKGYGAMKGAHLEKLSIGSTNIGWELPGNYNAEAAIDYLNVYEVFEKGVHV